MPEPKLPQKLDELQTMLNGVEAGWAGKVLARASIDLLHRSPLEEKLVEVGEAWVDDYCTSRLSEMTIEPQMMEFIEGFIRYGIDKFDRWAR